MSAEFIQWYHNRHRSMPKPAGQNYLPDKMVTAPQQDLHDLIQVLDFMLLDMNIGMMQRTQIKQYTLNPDFQVPTFHSIGLTRQRVVHDGIEQAVVAKNNQLLAEGGNSNMRDIRALKDLKYESWRNMYELDISETVKSRWKIVEFFNQFYIDKVLKILRSKPNPNMPPLQHATLQSTAVSCSNFSHDIITQLATNDAETPLKHDRMNLIRAQHNLPPFQHAAQPLHPPLAKPNHTHPPPPVNQQTNQAPQQNTPPSTSQHTVPPPHSVPQQAPPQPNPEQGLPQPSTSHAAQESAKPLLIKREDIFNLKQGTEDIAQEENLYLMVQEDIKEEEQWTQTRKNNSPK